MPRVKSFGSTYGITVEIQGAWHKLSSTIEVELDEGDDVSKVKQMAHDTVQLEVEKQLQAVVDSYSDSPGSK